MLTPTQPSKRRKGNRKRQNLPLAKAMTIPKGLLYIKPPENSQSEIGILLTCCTEHLTHSFHTEIVHKYRHTSHYYLRKQRLKKSGFSSVCKTQKKLWLLELSKSILYKDTGRRSQQLGVWLFYNMPCNRNIFFQLYWNYTGKKERI